MHQAKLQKEDCDCSAEVAGGSHRTEGSTTDIDRYTTEETLSSNQLSSASAISWPTSDFETVYPAAHDPKAPHPRHVLTQVKPLLETITKLLISAEVDDSQGSTLLQIQRLYNDLDFAPVKIDGHDLPDRSEVIGNSRRQSPACKYANRSNNDPDQHALSINASSGSRDDSEKLLRCLHFFCREGRPCQTTHKYVRDIVRHLRSHGFFFCGRCSESSTDRDKMKKHSCSEQVNERVCVDPNCANRPPEAQVHTRQSGCKFTFDALETRQKWYALYALVFPDSKPPRWDDVLAPAWNGIEPRFLPDTTPKPARAVYPAPSMGSLTQSHGEIDANAHAVLNAVEFDEGAKWSAFPTEIETVDASLRRLLEHVTHLLEQDDYLIGCSIAQNFALTEHNQKHEQQEMTNSNHDEQIRELESKIEELRTLVATSLNSNTQQYDREMTEEDVQLDEMSQ